MPARIAINGYGRIGRLVLRAAKQYGKDFTFVAIHDLADMDSLCLVTKYDSIHGPFPGSVEVRNDKLVVCGEEIEVLTGAVKRSDDPLSLPWRDMGVDYVVEATGVFRHVQQLEGHLVSGAKRVIVTSPPKEPLEATVVMGVNDWIIRPRDPAHQIISNSTCIANCAAPVAKVLHERFGIKKGYLSAVYAYTDDQRLFDHPTKDYPRARMPAMSIIPACTDAATVLGRVLPELEGKIEGIAYRVPVPTGSLVDLTVMLGKKTTPQEINDAMAEAAEGDLRGILKYSEDPLVSVDVVGNSHSAIFDGLLTNVRKDKMAKVVAWCDNEWGYAVRVTDLIEKLTILDGLD